MGFFDKIVKPVGIGLGAAALGSVLFPETMGSVGMNMFGSGGASAAGYSPTPDILGGTASTAVAPSLLGAAGKSSIWSDPSVVSAGILAGTSLLSGLFGSSAQDELAQQTSEENKRQFDAEMEYKKQALAQQLEIAKLNAAASGAGAGSAVAAAGIAARTNRDIAKSNAIGDAATKKAQALQIPLEARKGQVEAAQTSGAQSGQFFNQLMASLMQPALSAAR